MNYRKLGKSDVKVTPICFGAWAIGGWMWGGTDEKAAIEAVRKAIDMGITTIDTAPAYGMGLSEELVGKAINVPRDKVQILTKCGLRWDTDKGEFFFKSKDNNGKPVEMRRYSGKESIIEECENSLKRLKTDYLDLLQIHWPDHSTPISESMEAMEKLIKDGKIRAAGVSNFSKQEVKEANHKTMVASNQLPFSMVEQKIENNGTKQFCQEKNIGVIAYSPLQRGILTGKMTPDWEFDEDDHRPNTKHYKEPNFTEIIQFVEKLRPIAEERLVTIPQLVLNWTMDYPGIKTVLAGSRNPEQIEENAKAANFSLSEEEKNKINALIDELEIKDV